MATSRDTDSTQIWPGLFEDDGAIARIHNKHLVEVAVTNFSRCKPTLPCNKPKQGFSKPLEKPLHHLPICVSKLISVIHGAV